MPRQPLAEVFGFPIDSFAPEAERYRAKRLCPYNNCVPNCTKDKAKDPLGVCSVVDAGHVVVTCPIRFRQDWIIADDAAAFFFPEKARWTSLTEVRLEDKHGRSAGNVDVVLVSYDDRGRVVDFGAIEVQAVYISGNVRRPFEHYMEDPKGRHAMDWVGQPNYPRPDFLSSSRKRLAPQLIYKGGMLKSWGKKLAVVVDCHFFANLPELPETSQQAADIAWLIYELSYDPVQRRHGLTAVRVAYTAFAPALERITTTEPGVLAEFFDRLQTKLDEKLEGGYPPDAPTLLDEVQE